MSRPVFPALAVLAFGVAGGAIALPAAPAAAASYELCLQSPDQPYLWWREGTVDIGEESHAFEAYLGAIRCFRALGTGQVFVEANLSDRTPCDGPVIMPSRTRRVDVMVYEVHTSPYVRPRIHCRVTGADAPVSASLGDTQQENPIVGVRRQQRVTRHVAERPEVLRRRAVRRTNEQDLARRHVPQDAPRLQDGQRALQPSRVQQTVGIQQPVRVEPPVSIPPAPAATVIQPAPVVQAAPVVRQFPIAQPSTVQPTVAQPAGIPAAPSSPLSGANFRSVVRGDGSPGGPTGSSPTGSTAVPSP